MKPTITGKTASALYHLKVLNTVRLLSVESYFKSCLVIAHISRFSWS